MPEYIPSEWRSAVSLLDSKREFANQVALNLQSIKIGLEFIHQNVASMELAWSTINETQRKEWGEFSEQMAQLIREIPTNPLFME
jgi:hypothetical protein